MDSNELKNTIKKINSDLILNSSEKNVKIQQLIMNVSKTSSQIYNSNESKICSHYDKKNYYFKFNCCGIYDPCKRCHMERNTCQFDKICVNEITCSECNKTQEPSEFCIECSIKFANSYCAICNIWTQQKEIFHCDSCGVCRIGNKENIFHCHNCDACFATKNLITNQPIKHKCFQYVTNKNISNNESRKISLKESSCVVCMELIFYSQESSTFLMCGHPIHKNCFKQMIQQQNYKCPCCKKSICDMSKQWNYLRLMIELHPLPTEIVTIQQNDIVDSPYGKFKIINIKFIDENLFYTGEFINWIISNSTYSKAIGILNSNSVKKNIYKKIYCNDCNKKSISKFHYYGLECKECGSFNTQE